MSIAIKGILIDPVILNLYDRNLWS